MQRSGSEFAFAESSGGFSKLGLVRRVFEANGSCYAVQMKTPQAAPYFESSQRLAVNPRDFPDYPYLDATAPT